MKVELSVEEIEAILYVFDNVEFTLSKEQDELTIRLDNKK